MKNEKKGFASWSPGATSTVSHKRQDKFVRVRRSVGRCHHLRTLHLPTYPVSTAKDVRGHRSVLRLKDSCFIAKISVHDRTTTARPHRVSQVHGMAAHPLLSKAKACSSSTQGSKSSTARKKASQIGTTGKEFGVGGKIPQRKLESGILPV